MADSIACLEPALAVLSPDNWTETSDVYETVLDEIDRISLNDAQQKVNKRVEEHLLKSLRERAQNHTDA